jgi:hypothetical protein
MWLNDPPVFASKWRNRRQQEDSLLNFTFEGETYDNEMDLTSALLLQDEAAKRFLYRGIFTDFFKARNPALADKIIDITENRETAGNEDLGLAMFLHHLNSVKNPICPIYWRSESFSNIGDIAKAIFNGKSNRDNTIAMLKDGFLSWKLKNTPGINDEEIKTIELVESVTTKYPELGYYSLMYCCDPGVVVKPDSPDALFRQITANVNKWYTTAQKLLEDDNGLAYFVSLGFKKPVLSLKNKIGNVFISDNLDPMPNLILLYLLFEASCDDKEYVREHFINYGPFSYLNWLKNNLSLYVLHSQSARDVEMSIKGVDINSGMSINELTKAFSSLRQYLLNGFLPKFQNNYLLPYIGLDVQNEITTMNTHAYFIGDFYGITVPVGYLKTLGR